MSQAIAFGDDNVQGDMMSYALLDTARHLENAGYISTDLLGLRVKTLSDLRDPRLFISRSGIQSSLQFNALMPSNPVVGQLHLDGGAGAKRQFDLKLYGEHDAQVLTDIVRENALKYGLSFTHLLVSPTPSALRNLIG